MPPVVALLALASCTPNDPLPVPAAPDATRTYRMGFSAIPPRWDEQLFLRSLEMWTPRGDAALMHLSVPWKELLSGTSAADAVTTNDLPVAKYFRTRGLELFVTIDPTDGLNRAAEAPALLELGRSITEPEVQSAYRRYVLAVSSLVRPDHLGLVAETNLIRLLAPATLYAALVRMAGAAAADLDSAAARPTRYISVQVDAAWGRLAPRSDYRGVEQDFADFPWITALGLSSYPYFSWNDPGDIPLDYFARLRNGRTLPVFVVEAGWTSGVAGPVRGSPAEQADYYRRLAAIVDSAEAGALLQLTFTDLDLASNDFPESPILPLFAKLGLVDIHFRPKPALAVWDTLFARRLVP